jgi:hypothetical protein
MSDAGRLLSFEEIQQLTGFERPGAQCKALNQMGIPHHVRPDGRPVVVAAVVMGADMPGAKGSPDFSALGG